MCHCVMIVVVEVYCVDTEIFDETNPPSELSSESEENIPYSEGKNKRINKPKKAYNAFFYQHVLSCHLQRHLCPI